MEFVTSLGTLQRHVEHILSVIIAAEKVKLLMFVTNYKRWILQLINQINKSTRTFPPKSTMSIPVQRHRLPPSLSQQNSTRISWHRQPCWVGAYSVLVSMDSRPSLHWAECPLTLSSLEWPWAFGCFQIWSWGALSYLWGVWSRHVFQIRSSKFDPNQLGTCLPEVDSQTKCSQNTRGIKKKN